ncbi:MAG: ATP-binding protein [Planctomycetota bacterium]
MSDPHRRPVVLRGARQVGKTWLVRDLATRSGLQLIELNFEREPRLRKAFASNDPTVVLGELTLLTNREIPVDRSLLFLDEVQAAGELLAKLRWFYEELPALPVVAAGSLLEFTLAEHSFSMPVGRISFRHIEPMSFPEFLEAHEQERLVRLLAKWRPGSRLSAATHESATQWFHRYAMVGGMPSVVAADVGGRAPHVCRELQTELVATYRADFAKYAGRMDRNVLDSVLAAVAGSIGAKFVYAKVRDGVKQHQAKHALELLAAARLCHLVRYSSAREAPLGAEVKDSFRKAVLLDVGILHALVGTPAAGAFPTLESLSASLRNRVCDQLAAQQLRLLNSTADGPQLYYWQREGGRSGEVDYIIQVGGAVIPVELKAGVSGSMKSLHQYMYDMRLSRAVRCDANPPSRSRVEVATTTGDAVSYEMLSVPLYLLWNVGAILSSD